MEKDELRRETTCFGNTNSCSARNEDKGEKRMGSLRMVDGKRRRMRDRKCASSFGWGGFGLQKNSI